MHELSLCHAIVAKSLRHADGRRVGRVTVRIGYFRQVVPDTLTLYWRAATKGGDLEGAELEIQHVPATVRCAACEAETTLLYPILMCERCGSSDVTLLTGEEFQVVALHVVEVNA